MRRHETMSRFVGDGGSGRAGWIISHLKPSRMLGSIIGRALVLLLVFLFGGGSICWALPMLTPIGCPASGPPTDKDPIEDPGGSADVCAGVWFNVPAVPDSQSKQGSGGWGSLVLSFDRPIDGASFVFGPDCPTPLDGKLSPDGKSILLSPLLATPARAYALGPTNSPSDSGKGNFKMFEVTILYDVDGGLPELIFGYWKSKMTDFVYRPNPGDYGSTSGTKNLFDLALPEPPTVALLCLGFALVPFFGGRCRAKAKQALAM